MFLSVSAMFSSVSNGSRLFQVFLECFCSVSRMSAICPNVSVMFSSVAVVFLMCL